MKWVQFTYKAALEKTVMLSPNSIQFFSNSVSAVKSNIILLNIKCPQLSKPETTAARTQTPSGDRMEKKTLGESKLNRGTNPPLANKRTRCDYDSGNITSQTVDWYHCQYNKRVKEDHTGNTWTLPSSSKPCLNRRRILTYWSVEVKPLFFCDGWRLLISWKRPFTVILFVVKGWWWWWCTLCISLDENWWLCMCVCVCVCVCVWFMYTLRYEDKMSPQKWQYPKSLSLWGYFWSPWRKQLINHTNLCFLIM